MSHPATILWFLAAVCLFGLVAAWSIIRAVRRTSYQRWSTPLRWAFLLIVAGLVALGAAGLAYNYTQKWGRAAGAWLIVATLAYGIFRATERRP